MNSALDTNVNWLEQGVVVSMADGVLVVDNVLSGKLVVINGNVTGLALNIEKRYVKVVIFVNESSISQGDIASRTDRILQSVNVVDLWGLSFIYLNHVNLYVLN